MRRFFSASFARAKLSSPPQTLTNLLEEKKPPSAIPTSRKPLDVSRVDGFGFRSFLKTLNTDTGIAPREFAVGGVWGGWNVAGGGWLGLNTECKNNPRAYASPAATFPLVLLAKRV